MLNERFELQFVGGFREEREIVKMKNLKRKLAAWSGIFLLTGQYALTVPQVVLAETNQKTEQAVSGESAETTEASVRGIPGSIGKWVFKFVAKQALKQALLDLESCTYDPMASHLATGALRIVAPSKMIFRELDQIKFQLDAISKELESLKNNMNQRFLELEVRQDLDVVVEKREDFRYIGENYKGLSNDLESAMSAYETYVNTNTGENYQKFYEAYVTLMATMGKDNDAESLEVNFKNDLSQLVRLLNPIGKDGANQETGNYLYSVKEFASKKFVFRHQSYDLMTASFEEIVGQSLNFLMAYRTYTTLRVEDIKSRIYEETSQEERIKLVAKKDSLQNSYQKATGELFEAIEASVVKYLEPIINDYLSEGDRQTKIEMDYVETQHRRTSGPIDGHYEYFTSHAVDTKPIQSFYRVKPIGSQLGDSQPFGEDTANYYILNHGTDTEEEKADNINFHRIHSLWESETVILSFNQENEIFFANDDFFNLRQTKDDDVDAKLLENINNYKELYNMPSFELASDDFSKHLFENGELPKEKITGKNNKWLLNKYREPSPGVTIFEVIDGYIGLTDTNNITSKNKDELFQTRILSEKPYADSPSDKEPYLVILQGQKKEAYSLIGVGKNADLLSFDVAEEDYAGKGLIVSGSKVPIKVNLPEARTGYKNEITSLILNPGRSNQEVIYENRVSNGQGHKVEVNERYDVPTEFLATMPYSHTVVSLEYEEVKEAYDVEFINADEKGTLLPGYATFSAPSYLPSQAEFGENVEVSISPIEGYVATGLEIISEEGKKIDASRISNSKSGVPSIAGGVFEFTMPAGKVVIKPIYEKGVIVNLKTDPSELLSENVMTFTNRHVWDTNILNDKFDDQGNKINDTITRGTFKKGENLLFAVKDGANHVVKSIFAKKDGTGLTTDIPLNLHGEYSFSLEKDSQANVAITANYISYSEKNAVVFESKGAGQVSFSNREPSVTELPFLEGETVVLDITPDSGTDIDKKKLEITQSGVAFTDYKLNPKVDDLGNPSYQLIFEKKPGITRIKNSFTEENLVCLEAAQGTLRFKDSGANRGIYPGDEQIQIRVSPIEKFDKDSLQILENEKDILSKDKVVYEGDLLTFIKPRTTNVITVKGAFGQTHGITKVIEELGTGKNDFKVQNSKGQVIEHSYEGEKVTLSLSPESQGKLVQLQVVGEASGTKKVLDLTKELTFTMPDEAIRIEASFDNENGLDEEDQPGQNKDGHYVLKTYEQFVQAGKLMSLPLKDNTYQNATYVLDRIVDFKDQAWTPWASSSQPFVGTLDGKGFGIINLNVTGSGLIDTLGTEGTVKNLGVLSAKVTQEKQQSAGLIAALNKGTIDNVYLGLAPEITHVRVNDKVTYSRDELNLTLTQNSTDFGGMVGLNYGTIINSINYMTIASDQNSVNGVGAFAGTMITGKLVNSANLGVIDVSSAKERQISGGLIGSLNHYNLELKNNYNYALYQGSINYFEPSFGKNAVSNERVVDTNYYAELNKYVEKTQGTKLTLEGMKANTFKDKLNAAFKGNENYKVWNRKDNRNEGLPFLEGGHIFVHQLSQQTLNSGIFSVTSHVPYDTTLEVKNLLENRDVSALRNAVEEGKLEKLVDLSLTHPDVEVAPYAETKIKVDVSQFEKASEKRGFKLLHQTGDKVEEVALTREGNYLVGRVDSLSPFALVSAADEKEIEIDETPASPEGDNASNKGKLPMTGEQVSLGLTVLGAILCGSGLLYYKKRRETEKD